MSNIKFMEKTTNLFEDHQNSSLCKSDKKRMTEKYTEDLEMVCSKHYHPIILLCLKPKCSFKLTLCSKCVHQELDHINHHSPLTTLSQFKILFQDQIKVDQNGPLISQKLDYEHKVTFTNSLRTKADDYIFGFIDLIKKLIDQALQYYSNELLYLQEIQQDYLYCLVDNHLYKCVNQIITNNQFSDQMKQANITQLIQSNNSENNPREETLKHYKECEKIYQTNIKNFWHNQANLRCRERIETYLKRFSNLPRELVQQISEEQLQSNQPIVFNVRNILQWNAIQSKLINPHTQLAIKFQNSSMEPTRQVMSRISTFPIESLKLEFHNLQILDPFVIFMPSQCQEYIFHFNNTVISHQAIQSLPQMFQFGKSIQHQKLLDRIKSLEFKLGETFFDKIIAQSISEMLQKTENLEKFAFYIQSNELPNNSIELIKSIIKEKASLKHLCLGFNHNKGLTEEGIIKICDQFQNYLSLHTLELEFINSGIACQIIQYFKHNIKKISTLTKFRLNLSENQNLNINLDETLNLVVIFLISLRKINLSCLSLSLNQVKFTETQFDEVFEKISEIQSLEKLEFNSIYNGIPYLNRTEMVKRYENKLEVLSLRKLQINL